MSSLIRNLSIGGLVGGICQIAYSFVYAFTHGTISVNKMESVLGLNELEWGRIAVIIPLLLLAGLIAFGLHVGIRMKRITRIGYWLALAGLTIRLVSEVPQLFINMREEYQSFLGIGSWLLYLLSLPILIVGLFILGIGCIRSGNNRFTSFAPLVVGILVPLSLVMEGVLSGYSDDSTIFRLSAGLLSIPLGLAWSWLSIVSLNTFKRNAHYSTNV